MATNGDTQAFAPVLAALATMESNLDRTQKGQAHEYLEQYQKSVRFFSPSPINPIYTHDADLSLQPEAWTSTMAILHSRDVTTSAQLFAATTLKGKVG